MKRKPFQQLSLTSVLRELAKLSDVDFRALVSEVQGPAAFDTDQERISKIQRLTGLEEETLSLILSALNFLYSEIHSDGRNIEVTPEVIRDLMLNLERSDANTEEEKATQDEKFRLEKRLPILLERKQSTDRFRKAARLRAGFLPAAVSFASFVDLRPLLSEDQGTIEELIPLVQFRIRTDSNRPEMRNVVFQMDSSSLRLLKDAIDSAEKKLSSIANNDSIKHLVAKS